MFIRYSAFYIDTTPVIELLLRQIMTAYSS